VANLNGIVAKSGVLIVAKSDTGQLFRVDPATGIAKEIDLGDTPPLINADGLELRGHLLYVVRNNDNVVAVVRLGSQLATGTVLGNITDPGLDVPTTATVAAGRLWAVNARFGTGPTPDTEYWITQLPLRPNNGWASQLPAVRQKGLTAGSFLRLWDLFGWTKIRSLDPLLPTVWTAYSPQPLLALLDPPMELASSRQRGWLNLDRRIDRSAVDFAVLTDQDPYLMGTHFPLTAEEGHAAIKHKPQDFAQIWEAWDK
jgi:hypothetical protein